MELWHDFFEHLRSATTNSLSRMVLLIRGPTAYQVSFEDIPELQTFSFNTFTTNLFNSLSAANLFMVFACWPRLNCLHIANVIEVTICYDFE
jgi:hypothetical protein